MNNRLENSSLPTEPSTSQPSYKPRHFVTAGGKKLLDSLEKTVARYSWVENQPFLECNQFPWIVELEKNWEVIRQELDDLLEIVEQLPNFQQISADQYRISSDNLWKTFFFYGYGFKAEQNCQRCPKTTELIEKIPGMKTAFFSILFPHKHIPEHRGPYKGVLRYHLALKVPQQGCQIRVGNETRSWEEGKSLVFDDTLPHEVWNQSDEIRVVLFVDVVRPMKFPFSLLNQIIIKLISWSPFVQNAKREALAWEKRLEEVAPIKGTNH
ncbi:MAG: aspartyl/asparaginyl beta-hydroxylase domain-containing protein [Halothece sp.]